MKEEDTKPLIEMLHEIVEHLKSDLPNRNYRFEYTFTESEFNKPNFYSLDGLSKNEITYIKYNEILKKITEIKALNFKDSPEESEKTLETIIQKIIKLTNIHRDMNFNSKIKAILRYIGFYYPLIRTTSTLTLNEFGVELRQGFFGEREHTKKIGNLIHKATYEQKIKIGTHEMSRNCKPLVLG